MWRISCLRPAKMTVGGKAEMPLCTKHCATFWFWHLLIREERRSNSIYMFSKQPFRFLYSLWCLLNNTKCMNEEKESRFWTFPLLNPVCEHQVVVLSGHVTISANLIGWDRFIRNLLHWSHVNVDCLNRCINIQNTIFIALIICLGVNRYLNYSNNGF